MPLIALFLVFLISYAVGTYVGMKAQGSQK